MECANSRWKACGTDKNKFIVERNVSNAAMAVSAEATDSAKLKASVMEMELKGTLKRLSTEIEMKSQAASFVSKRSSSEMIARRYGILLLFVSCCIIA